MTSATIDTVSPQWRVRPVPVRTPPPLVVAPAPPEQALAAGTAIQGVLDLEMPRSRTHLRLLTDGSSAGSARSGGSSGSRDTSRGPELTALIHLPDAETFSARIAITLLEVVAGRRPLAHVGRVTSPEVYASLERRRIGTRTAGTRMRPIRVRRVVGTSPRDGVFDAAVVIDDQRRVRAMALRLLGIEGRWLVTELRLT